MRAEEGLEEGVYYLIADGFRTTSGSSARAYGSTTKSRTRAPLRDGAGGRGAAQRAIGPGRERQCAAVCSTDLRRALG